MSIFNRVISEIKDNATKRNNGQHIAIPFPFPRFSKYFPGLQQGRNVIVTASSKVGKSKITDYLFVYSPYEFIKNNKSNIKLKIFYFSLEMTKEDKIREYISYLLFKKFKIVKSPEEILSLFNGYILDEDTIERIQSLEEDVKEFERTVTFIDNIRNPFGVYKYMKDYADSNGYFVKKIMTFKEEDGSFVDKEVNDYYIANDPDEYVMCIIDNYNLWIPEKGSDRKASMEKWSSEYAIHLRNNYNQIIVGVQQQAAAQESVDNFKVGKLQPSADGLGDSKLTGRDCDVMFGLFAPNRYGIAKYADYDITKLKDNYREFSIILNRRGSSVATSLYFNGAVNYFEELPKPEQINYNDYIKSKT